MPSLGLGVGLATSAPPLEGIVYTTFKTWENDSTLIGSDGFQLLNWIGTAPTLSFETDALDGETDYAKLTVIGTQSTACQWRDNLLVSDAGTSINFSSFTKYRVQAKLYAILDSSRTEITFTTAFGSTGQNRFQTTLQDQTWTTIDVAGELTGAVSGTHFYLYDWDQSGNFPIADEIYALKDVKLSLA